MLNPNPAFWHGKRVLITGHTGFKGGWLALWLSKLGADLTGIALSPGTQTNLFQLAEIGSLVDSHIVDLRDADSVSQLVTRAEPDIAFHLAAQPLVRASYRDPLGTFSTNVQGSANLLEAVRNTTSSKVVVAVTTDKVYRNEDQIYPFREDDHLGGHDPYSASKAAAEIVIASYRDSYFASRGIGLASVRAGNVIGGGDWSEDRLIPDAVRSWNEGVPLEVRRPDATRPWQHVLEPLAAYLCLAEQLWVDPSIAGAYNIGPEAHEVATVRKVIELARAAYSRGEVVFAKQSKGPHEAGLLSLEISKARKDLGIEPRWSLETSIQFTMNWYHEQAKGAAARDLCYADIEAFEGSYSN